MLALKKKSVWFLWNKQKLIVSFSWLVLRLASVLQNTSVLASVIQSLQFVTSINDFFHVIKSWPI